MADIRRGRRRNDAGLTLVHGGQHSEPPQIDNESAAALADLRTMLVAAGAPEEVLGLLDAPGDPEEILHRLVDAGVLPSEDESLAELIASWKPLLKPGVSAFDAELAGSEFVGMIIEATPAGGELPAALADLIAQAEEVGGPPALAMLRVLAAIAPPQVRPAAAQAADRLVAAGLKDRPWAKGLGSPVVGPCFGYSDGFAQEAIAITFNYGRKAHGLAVLIDHELGGGVKDCWPTDRPDQIRAHYQQATRAWRLDLYDYEPAQARAILERALSQRPCPAAPDQIEDVRDYLSLLLQRVALLPGAGSVPTVGPAGRRAGAPAIGKAEGRARAATGQTVHRVKITLRGSKPPIWRRLEVPSGITLARLHDAVQESFGWHGGHLWVFETPYGYYGVTDPELGHRSAASKKLADVAQRRGDRIRYTYDFGDDWEHDIVVEDVLTAEAGVAYPRCMAGRRAGPPDDCGGIWGYAELLEILADPRHAEHKERLDWLGLDSADAFDPARFELGDVNGALSGLAKVLVKR